VNKSEQLTAEQVDQIRDRIVADLECRTTWSER